MTFREYYEWYKTQHTNLTNRRLHVFGSLLMPFVLLAFLLGSVLLSFWLLVPMVFALFFCAYGPAWLGHFVYEGNTPATWTNPWWSLLCDYRMLFDSFRSGSRDVPWGIA